MVTQTPLRGPWETHQECVEELLDLGHGHALSGPLFVGRGMVCNLFLDPIGGSRRLLGFLAALFILAPLFILASLVHIVGLLSAIIIAVFTGR